MNEYKVPGVIISVVKDGEIIFKKGYGYYDLENNKRVDPDNTLFRAGSVSKLFIWTSIMLLVEEGKLDLNENVNQYLDFEIPKEIIGNNKEDIKAITVMNLLNHIENNYNGYRIIKHGGDTILFHSGLYLIPELNTGLFVSYNGRDAAKARFLLIKSFIDRFFPKNDSTIAVSENSNLINPNLIEGKYITNRINHTTYESITKFFSVTNIQVDSSGNIIYNYRGETNRLQQIEAGVFYDQNSGNKLYASLNQDGEVNEMWTNSPNVLKRASWYEGLLINAAFVLGFIILTLILSFIWIKSLFNRTLRKKYFLEKLIPIIFGFLTIGFIAALTVVFSNVYPQYNIPYLFLGSSALFDKIMMFIWVLPIILILLLFTLFRVWFSRDWKISAKIFYTIYTIWSVGIIWWFYNLYFLVL